MGESIIEERLRRLREEGETEQRERNKRMRQEVKPELALMNLERGVTAMNVNAAPLEHLFHKGLMEMRGDEPGVGRVRLMAALRFRELSEGAEVSGMKSPAFDFMPSGSGGPKAVSDHRLDCIKLLGQLKREVPEPLYKVVEEAVYDDDWMWASMTGRPQEIAMRKLHRGLDHMAIFFKMMQVEEFRRRWRASPNA